MKDSLGRSIFVGDFIAFPSQTDSRTLSYMLIVSEDERANRVEGWTITVDRNSWSLKLDNEGRTTVLNRSVGVIKITPTEEIAELLEVARVRAVNRVIGSFGGKPRGWEEPC